MAEDERIRVREIALNKALITAHPGASIGDNFSVLKNMRYTDVTIKAVQGMSKINTASLGYAVKSIHQLRKEQYGESHVLVQAEDGDGNTYIFDNPATIPAQGDFTATPLYTEDADAGEGRWSDGPIGNVLYCNGAESLVYGGDELRVGAFINYDPGGSFEYDYTDQVRNTKTDAQNVATVETTDAGIDANTKAVWHLDNSLTDSSGDAHTLTNSGVTFPSGEKVFGTHSAKFTSGGAYLEATDSNDFSMSAGQFCVDMRVRPDTVGTAQTLYYQGTDANNYAKLKITDSGGVSFVIVDASSEVVSLSSPGGVLSVGTWFHVEVDEDDSDYYLFVDGKQKATVTDTDRAANYSGKVRLGRAEHGDEDQFQGHMDEVRVSNTARHTGGFEPQGTAYSTASATPWFYLGSTRPIDGFKLYIDTPNTQAGTMSVDYWDGSAFTSVGAVTDGTSTGGKSLAKTGMVTFTSTVNTAKVKSINGVILYWYRLSVTAADAATEIYHVSVRAPMQPIVDIWDSELRSIIAFQWYKNSESAFSEYSTNVFQDQYDSGDSGTYVELDSMGTSDYLVFGFAERMLGLSIDLVGGTGNTTANTNITVSYWNGAGWMALSDVDDGTADNGISFANSGIITWAAPESTQEFRREINKKAQLYYYKVSFDKALSSDVQAYYISGIPAQKSIGAFKFPLYAHNRSWLCSDQKGELNMALAGALYAVDVWSGSETQEFRFGDESEIVAATSLFTQFGSSLYNMTLFLKKQETWAVVGNGPEDWVSYRISPSVGCVAPKTLISASPRRNITNDLNRHVAFWQGHDGIYIFDGRAATLISDDISDLFDQESDTHINLDEIDTFEAFYDAARDEYHWLFASGTSTALDKELVFDLKRGKWFEIERPTGKKLQCGLSVFDTKGNAYPYGCAGETIFRLEHGATFDGDGITPRFRIGDVAPRDGSVMFQTDLIGVQLVTISKTSDTDITAYYYGNGSTVGEAMELFSQANAGYEYAIPTHNPNKTSKIFHSVEFYVTTDVENIGFEPIFLGIKYKHRRLNP